MITEGFIDIHTHGLGRYDTRTDKPEHILKIAEHHGKAGTQAICPTIYSAPIDKMRGNIEAVREAMHAQNSEIGFWNSDYSATRNPTSGIILGVHLEGPFLNPLKCGALKKSSFVKPTISSLRKLIEGYEDIIKIITIAPEIPGALKVIEKCKELGFKVNMGHSDATYKQAVGGKKAGATGITHLFNAMRPFHHREPGLAGLALSDEDLYVEVIADGIHLHPKTLELIFSIKRLDRIIIISDSVKGGKKGKPVYDEKGTLSGSSITISDSINVLKDIGIPEGEIIEATTDNPARYIGLKL